jgi:hypothetical protein
MIPKPQYGDSVISEDLRARFIANLTEPIIMPATVQFDRELSCRTIEIEGVAAEWMLTAKFVSRKISVPEMAPKIALGVGCLLSQHASAIHGTSLYLQK